MAPLQQKRSVHEIVKHQFLSPVDLSDDFFKKIQLGLAKDGKGWYTIPVKVRVSVKRGARPSLSY